MHDDKIDVLRKAIDATNKIMGITERFLICNGCGKTYGVDNRERTFHEHRKAAQAEGWIYAAKADYCSKECMENPKVK